ncbi:MAG: hypothetical protein JEZ04_11590 [Spirochaetales bacterium]|nr:hypothetical protein [Spirochaetales bacterium]
MKKEKIRSIVLRELKKNDGILFLRPSWVSRDFMPPGKRLGLSDAEYDVGKRGYICERWLVSETRVDNRIKVENEGLSYLKIDGEDILLTEALAECREEILGTDYSKNHNCLGRLLKIYDFGTRIFYHLHQMDDDAAKVGMNSKEEAYHFLDKPLGPHPETFFGVHPSVVRENRQKEIFLKYLRQWEGESILKYSRAYLNVPGEGFHLPSGLLHAPGTALTLELQESSDVMAVLQAEIEGLKIGKDLLHHHIPEDIWTARKEEAALDLVDWEANADPYFYENYHLSPQLVEETRQDGAIEEWVWYNTVKFSGLRITVEPGKKFFSRAGGVHGLFIWRGTGNIDGFKTEGQKVSLTQSRDELLMTADKALAGYWIENTCNENMVIFKFFGPDINVDNVPYIKKYK